MNRYNNYHKHDHVSNIFTPDCNVKAEDYVKKSLEYGHTNYFTTNHGSFGDIFEARTLCDKYGLRCIAGIEGYIVPNAAEKDKRNYHIIVIPKTDEARKRMNYVSSNANINGYYYKPRFFMADMLALPEDDIYITSACCAGLLRDEDSINQILLPLIDKFGENVLLEVQTHLDEKQKEINLKAIQMKEKFGLSLIAANDSHYIDAAGQTERLELLKGKKITYDDEDSFILDFPDYDTMVNRFRQQEVLTEDQIQEAMDSTLLFDECEEIQLDHSIKMPTIYPDLTPAERVAELKKEVNRRFKEIRKTDGITDEEFPKYKDGIRYEMKIIEDTNEEIHTADYFLFNTKNVELAVNKYGGVLTRGGRGSCASFYINRILGMTQLDRFRIKLPIFPDRFASTARLLENRALPDIDYNVKEQGPFVAASRELLGEHGCYPMYAPGTMQLSEAFRNVCRSKGMPFEDFNDVAKDIENHLDDKDWAPILEEANKYVGTIISGSVHPCAHLLSNNNILYEYGVTRLGENLCVLITSAEADEYKVLKNDYLVVTVWKLIDETFKEIGKPIIPAPQLLEEIKDDHRIWDLFANGITCTLNQVDSDNGTNQAKRYGVASFEDMASITASIRPSFDAWRDQFLNHTPYSTGSLELDNVLSMTGHYILYQENLMQYFEWLGVSPGESIGLIKKISKKKIKPEDFLKLEERIKKQWIINTGSEDKFQETWEMIQGCISYGYCAPHAGSVALDACYGAYLKVHYPLEYYTVCFNNYADDEVRTRKLTKELDYFGIKLGGIEYGHSRSDYSYDHATNTIYKGLRSIKFISEKCAEDLYELSQHEYDTFVDLLVAMQNSSIDSRQLDILIRLNYFKPFGNSAKLQKIVEMFNTLNGKKQLKLDKLAELGIPEYIVTKCAKKITAKIAKDFDWQELLNEWIAVTEFPKSTLIDHIRAEHDLLGYIQTTAPNASSNLYYITDDKGDSSRMLTLYQIKTGDTKTVKCRKKVWWPNPIHVGSVIKVLDIHEEKKWGKDANGEWIRKEETEPILGEYVVMEI